MYMNIQQRAITQFSYKRRWVICLPVAWILGIVFGATGVISAENTYLITDIVVTKRPNLFLLFVINVLPIYLFTAIFVFRSYGLVFIMMFLYGLFRGFCGMCTVLAFGSGGWLVRCLLLFSGSAVSVLMWWLTLSYFVCRCHVLKLLFSLLFVSLVTFIDYFVISPFLIGII